MEKPNWPGEPVGRVIEYIVEEVERQGHNTHDLDGIQRVAWMTNAWAYAMKRSTHEDPQLRVQDAIKLGRLVESEKNRHGVRRHNVRVGKEICPPWENVPFLLDDVFKIRDEVTPLNFYRQFCIVHPFADGNGRTGKILLNWLNGSLSEPVFPPNDFWGESIRNP